MPLRTGGFNSRVWSRSRGDQEDKTSWKSQLVALVIKKPPILCFIKTIGWRNEVMTLMMMMMMMMTLMMVMMVMMMPIENDNYEGGVV